MTVPYTPIQYNEGPAKAVETLAALLDYVEARSNHTGNGFDGEVLDNTDFSVYETLKLLKTIHTDYVLLPKSSGFMVDPQGTPSLAFKLVDAEDGTDTTVAGRVAVTERGVFLSFADFQTVHDDTPILVEQIGGVPRVVVWADNQEEDATHHIGLMGARIEFPVGSRVYWTDPAAEEPCSKWCTVRALNGEIYQLVGDDGGEVEAFEHELRK